MEKTTLRLHLDFPKILIEGLWENEKEAALEIKKAAMLDLVREGKITSAKAAEILGLSLGEFMELMSQHNVPMASFPPKELTQQLKDLAEAKKSTH